MMRIRMTFREQLDEAHPALTERQAKNTRKREIAVKFRALRDARGLTKSEVAEAAGMTQSMVVRLEALSGPVPGLDSIERYVEACRGRMELLTSADEADIDAADEIIALIEAWTGSHAQAVAWYDSQLLPSFENLTADELVREGRADAVKAYVKRIADGGYA